MSIPLNERLIVRKAQEGDAKSLQNYMLNLAAEKNPNIPLLENELLGDISLISQNIKRTSNSKSDALLLLVDGERIVGRLDINGSTRHAYSHIASLGLSIAYNDRNKGLGKTLLEYGINYLRNSKTVHRVEILVNTENKIAISLYEKNGFKIEAIQKDKVFFMGEYYDASLYSLLLN
ncbi:MULTISPECIES: GNAT family N-acetyltransferase [Pseudomonas]|jgi:RimJ/RimL family protein N-acetyltransferase|nr:MULTISPECIES: GNAT family protein [Pseudomonas]HCL2765170.1 GNAT family N-acetyltransferase [Pseudomonas aeruginosa 449A]HCL2788896.1 GNAT family N-acetyltransferase [Pseudomonas aeruginosa 1BAE]ASA29679.1 N-acetyltransferase [Pseudomonas aeruginosa]ASD04059.1 N-acetyltransferase [Pseudomonas aeruginosa]AVE33444.1 N-acetyltransferase [Pseudomonas aeruginosa]